MIAALLLCLAAVTAGAEVTAKNTEKDGKLKETVWLNEKGKPAPGPDGYATVKYTYKQQTVTEMYYDAAGKPFKVDGGYFGRAVTKDGKGHVTQIEYLDKDGKRTLNRLGYGMVTMSYYGFGEVRNIVYYGTGKQKVIVPSLGYASVYTEYSGKVMTARIYRDLKGDPVDCKDGYATVKQKLNKKRKSQVDSIRYDHANGKPATGPDGWWRCVKDWDDNGRLLSVKYYDTKEKLTDRGAGYAYEKSTYEGDNIVKTTRYDVKDKVIADAAGVVTLVQEKRNDRVVKERFLDKDGKRMNNALGVGEILYSYDSKGAIEKVTYQDTEGKPCVCADGYAGYRDTRDSDGATVKRTFLGTDGNPAETHDGYSEIRYEYDETKQLSSTRYYDLNGTEVPGK